MQSSQIAVLLAFVTNVHGPAFLISYLCLLLRSVFSTFILPLSPSSYHFIRHVRSQKLLLREKTPSCTGRGFPKEKSAKDHLNLPVGLLLDALAGFASNNEREFRPRVSPTTEAELRRPFRSLTRYRRHAHILQSQSADDASQEDPHYTIRDGRGQG